MESERLTEEAVRLAGPVDWTTLYRLPDGDADSDGNQLFLFRWHDGDKKWKLLYSFKNKKHWFALGSYPFLSLEDARNAAAEVIENLASGITPEDFIEQMEDERKNRLILNRSALARLKSKTLFYPCSGNDFDTPIRLFAPFVTDFWFVDRGYFVPGHQDTRRFGLDAPANKQAPALDSNEEYRLIESTISGPPSWKRSKPGIVPCILTETYKHIPSRKKIRVHRRRGYGLPAFRSEVDSIAVFFYRGDSAGEGGSGNLWMNCDHVNEVCDKLVNGGLIVTDGSNGGRCHVYDGLTQFHGRDLEMEPEDLVESVDAFSDSAERRFSCIGYAGYRYGPTLIWRVRQSDRR